MKDKTNGFNVSARHLPKCIVLKDILNSIISPDTSNARYHSRERRVYNLLAGRLLQCRDNDIARPDRGWVFIEY